MEKTLKKYPVLLAEDSKAVREGIAALLTLLPQVAAVTAVDNAEEAIQWARQTKAGLAFIDARLLGKLDGIDAAQIILKELPGIKVIFITSYEEANYVLNLLKTGAHGLLLKRLTGKADLQNAIEAVLSNERYFTENVQLILTNNVNQIDNLRPIKLTVRELSLLQLLTHGLTTRQIAETLHLSEYTVETQRKDLLVKVRVQNTVELVSFAHRCGLI